MKKFLLTFILGFCCLMILGESTALAQKNVISWTPTALVNNKKIAINYERVLTPNISVKLGFGYNVPRQGIPGLLLLKDQLEQTSAGILSADFDLTGWEITPEVRFYPGKNGAPRGFFIGPFFRYHQYNASTIGGQFTDNDGDDYVGDFDADFKILGFGLLLGAQTLIQDRIALDFHFGLGYSPSKFIATVSNISNVLPGEYEEVAVEIQQEFDDVLDEDERLENLVDLTTSYTDSSGTAEGKVPMPIVRLGISIGFAF